MRNTTIIQVRGSIILIEMVNEYITNKYGAQKQFSTRFQHFFFLRIGNFRTQKKKKKICPTRNQNIIVRFQTPNLVHFNFFYSQTENDMLPKKISQSENVKHFKNKSEAGNTKNQILLIYFILILTNQKAKLKKTHNFVD